MRERETERRKAADLQTGSFAPLLLLDRLVYESKS